VRRKSLTSQLTKVGCCMESTTSTRGNTKPLQWARTQRTRKACCGLTMANTKSLVINVKFCPTKQAYIVPKTKQGGFYNLGSFLFRRRRRFVKKCWHHAQRKFLRSSVKGSSKRVEQYSAGNVEKLVARMSRIVRAVIASRVEPFDESKS
jgi:hypothetical protein